MPCRTSLLNSYNNRYIVYLLFETSYPLDTRPLFPTTETVSKTLSLRRVDLSVHIETAPYLLEFQMKASRGMTRRVFDYCFQQGKRSKDEKTGEETRGEQGIGNGEWDAPDLKAARTTGVYLRNSQDFQTTTLFPVPQSLFPSSLEGLKGRGLLTMEDMGYLLEVLDEIEEEVVGMKSSRRHRCR